MSTLPEAKLDVLLAHHASLEAQLMAQVGAEDYVRITRELSELNPLVEAVKRDFLDQLQQLRDAVAKEVEDEVAEQAIFGDQFLEYGNWQKQQREGCFGDAAG